jgi:hypothetical protein
MDHQNDSAIVAEQQRLSILTKKGIGMPMAGLLYWLTVGIVLGRVEPGTGLILCFALTGPVFPVGYGLTRLLGGDLFAKSRTLTPLGIQLAALQLFYWPILVLVYRTAQAWTPWAMALLFGSHFLPYMWLYRSRAYGVLAASVAAVLTVSALITRDPMYDEVAWIAAACYAGSVAMLWWEVRGLPEATATA